jgi:putative flavoprotein involved in K+ transport
VHLAVGSSPTQLPQRILGRDLFWWLTWSGVIDKPATSPLVRRIRARGDLVIGSSRQHVAELGVTLRPRVVDATPTGAVFADGTGLQPSAVVWATGFSPDHGWIDIPGAFRSDSEDARLPAHERGVSPVPGLYFLGLPWQHTRGSALLGFVRQDAGWLAERINTTG